MPAISGYSVSSARLAAMAKSDMDADSPETGAYMTFLEKTYEGTPYANAGRNDSDAILEIGPEELSGWHDRYYGIGGFVVSVSAGGSPGEAAAYAERAFGPYVDTLSEIPAGQDSISDAPVVKTARYESLAGAGGSAAMLGYTAPPVGSPDYAAVKLAEAVVADGMGSRLFRSLRGEDRLAYSFGSILPEEMGTSRLAFYVSADEEKIEHAVEAVRDSVEDLKRGALSDDEMDRARASLLGSIRGGAADPEESAWKGGLYELMGLGPDYAARLEYEILGLDAEDIREVANRYLNEYTLVIIKPESRIR
jgi:predicted Zn-dependent peptidase